MTMTKNLYDVSDILGHAHVKRGLEVALSGMHNVVLVGPSGSGKTMLKEAFRNIIFPGHLTIKEIHPCGCGNFTDPNNECTCSPKDIQNYLNTLNKDGFFDHIDICIEVPKLNLKNISNKTGESSEWIAKRVKKRLLEQERKNNWFNSARPVHTIVLDKEADELLKLAILELGISAYAYDKILRVAQTIANMEDKDIVESHHISEAISYRSLDRNLWG